jgi:ketosteroid isomerase-like protein
MVKFVTMAGAMLALGGCQVANKDNAQSLAAGGGAAVPTQAEAEKIVDAIEADFTSGDAMKMMSHYADGAAIIDPGHADPTTDRNVQTQWAAGFMAMKPSDMVTKPRTLTVLDADTIVSTGVSSFAANVGQGRPVLKVRYTDVYQRQPDGSWKIVAEHISNPPAATVAP